MIRIGDDPRDIYYRRAKEEGYRARSVYKLAQVVEEFDLLNANGKVQRVVDLCAAPGSWSQWLRNELFGQSNSQNDKTVKLVSVDLQATAPIDDVYFICGDILADSTRQQIFEFFENETADLVVCDGAPDVTGVPLFDEPLQYQLICGALDTACSVLRVGGTFVAKAFRGPLFEHCLSLCSSKFESVDAFKPSSSRNSSLEVFLVCQKYNGNK